MTTTGALKDVSKDWKTGKTVLSFLCDHVHNDDIDELAGLTTIDITAQRHKKSRSLNANAMLWACIGDLAAALQADKWEIYLKMLRRYGKFTYICVKPGIVEAVKKQWRECEEIGTVNINGTEAAQLLCYFGSSTYDTKEFSTLLDGVISEMKEAGITPPLPKHIQEALKQWEKNGNR